MLSVVAEKRFLEPVERACDERHRKLSTIGPAGDLAGP